MSHIIISEGARNDIERLYHFLSEKDSVTALRAVRTIQQAFAPLRAHPMIGRPVEDEMHLREIIIDFGESGYVALYRHIPEKGQTIILAIRHQREGGYVFS